MMAGREGRKAVSSLIRVLINVERLDETICVLSLSALSALFTSPDSASSRRR
jgi:hypothetical protein